MGANPAVFQARRCSACGGNLDLPTVHFMCKHSFHQRCLNQVDDDVECPVCAPDNATIRAIRRGSQLPSRSFFIGRTDRMADLQRKMSRQTDTTCFKMRWSDPRISLQPSASFLGGVSCLSRRLMASFGTGCLSALAFGRTKDVATLSTRIRQVYTSVLTV